MSQRFPYGETNFELIRQEKSVFIDKTNYIAKLEQQPKFQFFIRPRRFGKTLWLSVLENYYDTNKASKFDALFGDLHIGKNPTPHKNSYFVLRLSFAGITTDQGKDILINDFVNKVRSSIESFLVRYSDYVTTVVLNKNGTAADAMTTLCESVANANKKLFLIIDEYDNFANELISSDDKELYYDLISGDGYVKAFYKAIKEGTSSSIERLFMTGVSPIMLDDLTSGFNITANLTLKPEFNEMLGLTNGEVEALSQQVCPAEMDLLKLQEDMRLFFNGYKFSSLTDERVYNTNMVIYFLEELRQSGRYPQYILDRNVVTDYRKTELLAKKFDAHGCLQRIASGGTISTKLVDRFDLNTIFEIKDNYWSLLFYLGLLTIKTSQFNRVELGVPNFAIKSMFWENFGEMLRAQTQVVRSNDFFEPLSKMALEGSASDFVKQFGYTFTQLLSYRDLIQLDEKHIKLTLLAILHLGGTFLVDSERELGEGYADILLSENPAYPNSAKYEWIIELKYIKKKSLKEYAKITAQATDQAERYRSAYVSKYNNGKIVKTLVLICSGKGKLEIAHCS